MRLVPRRHQDEGRGRLHWLLLLLMMHSWRNHSILHSYSFLFYKYSRDQRLEARERRTEEEEEEEERDSWCSTVQAAHSMPFDHELCTHTHTHTPPFRCIHPSLPACCPQVAVRVCVCLFLTDIRRCAQSSRNTL